MASGVTRRAALAAGAAVWLTGCGGAIYGSGRRAPPGRVLIFPAHITLGERRLGGAFHLRRDWSEAVRTPVLDAAVKAVARRGRVPVLLDGEDDAQTAWALARLHRPVAESLMAFDAGLTGGWPVPTRGRPGLGAGGRALAARHDAPTGLFISVAGDYAEGWQRASEVVLREALALEVVGVERRLIVSLVELETGAIYWSGARRDRNLRNPARAERHVRALIAKAGFRRPGSA
ncbi:MAG: hypothetical protein RKE49_10080 [Oceanicaulis sp.]